ncbi:MAG TPA: glycosyltransferase family 2 protein [Candidatus Coprenecus stercoravium]|uniref:Glycosyltransferase family 2 protein n=1 Tax=Candidatus Coprenecus stercoravium TaxID=2840735 RepID=A0A9D2GPW0_9BACT|nr:glycosyltransferase family 2 protein [Candidatus Coprenecus stercoravium]
MSGKISIIIVNYNTGSLLRNCLKSIQDTITVDYEVIVADNASTDESLRLCSDFELDSRFKILRLESNVGFARANNIAVDSSTGSILHFLNPDTEVSADLNRDYETVTAAPDDVYVNPLLNPDGTVENRPKPLPLIRDMFFWYFCRKKARKWYKGASVIISRDNFEKIGRWSEDYFMYTEDLDLFYTLWRYGIRVTPLSSTIFHYGGGSSSRRWTDLEREVMVQRSTRIFYQKYFSKFQYVAIKLYFIFHYLLKNPRRVPGDIKAWRLSRNQ